MFQEDFQFHQDEKTLYTVRRHWIFLLGDILQIALYFIMFAVIVWIFQYLDFIPSFNIFGISFNSFLDILVYMWGIICWLLFAEKFTDYALDFWLVTNKRIIDSNLERLFHRYLATLELKDIEDISVKTTGMLSSYFSYGNLEVQTAGAQNRFEMEQIARPELVQRIIFEAKLADEKEQKDIEKGEFEQISHRVFHEEQQEQADTPVHDFHIPHDQKMENIKQAPTPDTTSDAYDWAHVGETQAKDPRNSQEILEDIEDKYKNDVDDALRTE